jgi:hypothetical protein
MKPKEGMLTWACSPVAEAKNVDLAYDFINSRLDMKPGKYLIQAMAARQLAFHRAEGGWRNCNCRPIRR